MRKIVLDTNVLVFAFLKPRSIPARILRLVIQGDLEIIVNAEILAEYTEVLARPKFELDSEKVRLVLDYIRSVGISAPSLLLPHGLPDPADEPFIESAVTAKTDALITGNKKHFPKRACKAVKVYTPTEFLQEVRNPQRAAAK